MILVVLGLRYVLPTSYRKLYCVINCSVCGIVGSIVYLSAAYKMHILEDVFGKEYLNKIIKKLTLGKVSIKN